MLVTVAICTWNRSRLLQQALTRMAAAAPPPGVTHEVIVVNNNCTDDTDEVISSFAARLPIRQVFEPRPGQSNARNAAIGEARGDYILWTDDDVLVDGDWIAAYVRAFRRWPAGVVFGGPIAPEFAVAPPSWVVRAWPIVSGAYAIRELGPEPVRFDGQKLVPYGANFAVRLNEQRQVLFDPDLGLRPGSTLRGDELAVVRELLARGLEGWWVPEATVRHFIPANRLTVRYVRDYYVGYGEYCAKADAREGNAQASLLFGRPRWLWRSAIFEELRYRMARIFRPPEVWVRHLISASTVRGQLRQSKL